jgi:hypothetical protein
MRPGFPARLTWLTLLPLDVSLSLAILGVCAAMSLTQTPILQQKARMAEIWSNALAVRDAAIEDLSVTGEFTAPSTLTDSTAEARGEFSYRYAGGRVDASGTLRGGGPVFQLSLVPAIRAVDGGWSVIWVCGRRKAPPGWILAALPVVENLKAEELPYVCRDLKAE